MIQEQQEMYYWCTHYVLQSISNEWPFLPLHLTKHAISNLSAPCTTKKYAHDYKQENAVAA